MHGEPVLPSAWARAANATQAKVYTVAVRMIQG